MIRTSTSTRLSRQTRVRGRAGFTLIELMVVVIVIGILIGLLLPVIAGAVRTANNAATQAEINQLAQALASFKSNYGDYPPSRVYLSEAGVFPVGTTTQHVNGDPNDLTVGQLAQRSLAAMRKFFPKVIFSSTLGTPPPNVGATFWYDYNGNGVLDNDYILQGDECLVFFLGGIPYTDPATGTFAMTGFGKDPSNPFTNNIATDPRAPYNGQPNAMYSPNRQSPMYEFNGGRLFLDPNNPSTTLNKFLNLASPGIPAYYDTLGNAPPPVATAGGTLNFYVYFSGYGSGVYDANDVNFQTEVDGNQLGPIGLNYTHAGKVYPSLYPNPYTLTSTITTSGTVTFEKAQTFQIFSSGRDGLYGVGGQFIPPTATNSTANNALPFDNVNTFAGTSVTTDGTLRKSEIDNLTNFKSGTLQ